ncbi:hypothetical protein TNCV_1877301 [Trichonephila clavipes]|nr:hypothetical protein TNCV_1877301 [Trichonephila clavipes]
MFEDRMVGGISAGLSSFRALSAEDLQASLALVDSRRGSGIRLSPACLDPSGPLGTQWINLHRGVLSIIKRTLNWRPLACI